MIQIRILKQRPIIKNKINKNKVNHRMKALKMLGKYSINNIKLSINKIFKTNK